jgi:hypothetical protein
LQQLFGATLTLDGLPAKLSQRWVRGQQCRAPEMSAATKSYWQKRRTDHFAACLVSCFSQWLLPALSSF